jgi:hypothetical protein
MTMLFMGKSIISTGPCSIATLNYQMAMGYISPTVTNNIRDTNGTWKWDLIKQEPNHPKSFQIIPPHLSQEVFGSL